MTPPLFIRRQLLRQIQCGLKTIEIRCNIPAYAQHKVGDKIEFKCSDRATTKTIIKAKRYGNLDSLFQHEDYKKCLPSCNSKNEAVDYLKTQCNMGYSPNGYIAMYLADDSPSPNAKHGATTVTVTGWRNIHQNQIIDAFRSSGILRYTASDDLVLKIECAGDVGTSVKIASAKFQNIQIVVSRQNQPDSQLTDGIVQVSENVVPSTSAGNGNPTSAGNGNSNSFGHAETSVSSPTPKVRQLTLDQFFKTTKSASKRKQTHTSDEPPEKVVKSDTRKIHTSDEPPQKVVKSAPKYVVKYESHPLFALYEDENGKFHRIRIRNPDRKVRTDEHSDDILCPYKVNCHFNRLPFRSLDDLYIHLSKDHVDDYSKQSEPMPDLIVKFPDNQIQIHLQCGHCVNYYLLGYTRHYDHNLKKGTLNLKWECGNMDLLNFRHRVKSPIVSLTGKNFFDSTFGDGSFDYLQRCVSTSKHIDSQLKENLEWSIDKELGAETMMVKFYILKSDEKLKVYVGHTADLMSIRTGKHMRTAKEVCELLKAKDARISIFAHMSDSDSITQRASIQNKLEYFLKSPGRVRHTVYLKHGVPESK